jgi:hypothetical protein
LFRPLPGNNEEELMKTRQTVLALLAGLLVLAWGSSASAGERNYWRHSQGHFENTDGNKWVEKKMGEGTYHFVETSRNDNFVQIYDKSQECTVRLYGDKCMVKHGSGAFEKYYDGKWGK